MSSRHIVLSMAILLGPLACGTAPEVASIGPQTPHRTPATALHGPYVQAGTLFSVALDQPIDTYYTPPGTRFVASVRSPLKGPDGRTLVPYGAKVQGTVASVGEKDAPLLRVQLDSIDTVAGTLPLHATVHAAQHYDWKGPATPEPYASYVYAYDFLDYGSATAAPGLAPYGAAPDGMTLMQPKEIDIPTGALVQLQLTEALVVPGGDRGK